MHEENSTKTTQDPGDELTADSGRASDASPAGTHRALSLVPLATLVAVVGTAVRIAVLNVIAAVNDQELWDRLTSWDSKYYLEIARVGYFDADIHTLSLIHI